ncbi:hypothetical protein Barb7_02282 [Bacteroidales bacterium Barb7]|nr:hypothetical protein Barb7_02282 [Bacteroidales bacterium Barb7]
MPPRQLFQIFFYCNGMGEFAPRLPFEEKEMDIPVIIRHRRLFGVAEARDSRQTPDPNAPFGHKPQADGGINTDKP